MKPMLAFDPKREGFKYPLRWPLCASYKLDGIRSVIVDDQPHSRTLKLIPNKSISESEVWKGLSGLDGELIVGPPNHPNVMQNTTSGVMSHDGEPDWRFYVFDLWDSLDVYLGRYRLLNQKQFPPESRIQVIPSVFVSSMEEIEQLESIALELGYEGLMLRDINSRYKFGRSTEKEFALVKVKRFSDAEAVIIGYNELMHNTNSLEKDNLGNAKRSQEKQGMVPGGVLGSLIARTPDGVEFSLSGFTLEQRKNMWLIRDSLIGKFVKYKFFPSGIKIAPRFPTFIGFRDRSDIG